MQSLSRSHRWCGRTKEGLSSIATSASRWLYPLGHVALTHKVVLDPNCHLDSGANNISIEMLVLGAKAEHRVSLRISTTLLLINVTTRVKTNGPKTELEGSCDDGTEHGR